jgi:hypothetical protein
MLERRQLALAGAAVMTATALNLGRAFAAASKQDAEVTQAVEAFRKAMLAADRKQFDALCADGMSYGHSSGRVQNKAEFIEEATSGKSTWKSITFSDETVSAVGPNGIARITFTGQSESQGKVNDVHIGVLMVWLHENGQWKLLARQGFKI